MMNNTPPNSFFSLVIDNEEADKELSENEIAEEEIVNNEFSEKAEEGSLGESDSVMPHDARRVLVYLMRQGSLMASQKSRLFELLCRYEVAIRKHLSEVYLQLVLDQKAGVAFVASAAYQNGGGSDAENGVMTQDTPETDESVTLIPKRTLSLYDTLVLLVLRKHYQDRESAGEQKIIIDIERLESYLTPFLPLTDHASKDHKKLLARVKEMVKRKVLSTIRGAEDRYEITPIIRYVVSASFLESMLDVYMELASGQNNNRNALGEANE